MQKKRNNNGFTSTTRWKCRRTFYTFTTSVTIGLLLSASPANAVDLEFFDGAVVGSIDTTVSVGLGIGTDGADYNENPWFPNIRDWTFDGIYSNQWSITPEMELKWKNYGFFGRVGAYWDTRIAQGSSDSADYPMSPESLNQAWGLNGTGLELQGNGNGWSDDAEDDIGLGFRFYDFYGYASHDIGDMPVDIRLGNQAFNWGEGSFFFDGINTTNAFDLNNHCSPCTACPSRGLREAVNRRLLSIRLA
jgi:hypothetical protein